jgi:hypothetical protein
VKNNEKQTLHHHYDSLFLKARTWINIVALFQIDFLFELMMDKSIDHDLDENQDDIGSPISPFAMIASVHTFPTG